MLIGAVLVVVDVVVAVAAVVCKLRHRLLMVHPLRREEGSNLA